MDKNYNINVSGSASYVEAQSSPEETYYLFAYTMIIKNTGLIAVKLLRRHWIITDANGKVQKVSGEGVIGEKPHIMPGKSHQYSSASVIETPVGCMQGYYEMIADNGDEFRVAIPVFNLSLPGMIH